VDASVQLSEGLTVDCVILVAVLGSIKGTVYTPVMGIEKINNISEAQALLASF
jgi:hypothetical protein